MANYFSGEEIKVGDLITTDNGHDKNKVMKLIDNTYLMQSYGLDCFGALLSSSSAKGMIFVSFKELSSPDTKFIRSFFSIRKQFVICRKGAKEHTSRIFFWR